MGNLNQNDVLFLGSSEFGGFIEKIENEYDVIVRSYDLPPYVSFTSRKAVIHTNKGTFFLKEKPEYCSSYQRRESAADFQEYLSEQISIVPRIQRTRHGDRYIQWNDRFLFLSEYKPGRLFNGSIDDLESILVALQRLQVTALGYKYTAQDSKSYDLLIPTELIKKFCYSDKDREDFERIEKVLEKIKNEYLCFGSVPYVMSHGDFSLFNILFTSKSIASINDFDNAQPLPRIQDLAEFLVSSTLINYLAPLSNLKHPVYLDPERIKFRMILNYYRTEFQLSELEMRLLPVLAELVWLDILLLAVLKEDYTINDIMPGIACIEQERLRMRVTDVLDGKVQKLLVLNLNDVDTFESWQKVGLLRLLQAVRDHGGLNIVVSELQQAELALNVSRAGIANLIDEVHTVSTKIQYTLQASLKLRVNALKEIQGSHLDSEMYVVGNTDADFHAARVASVAEFFYVFSDHSRDDASEIDLKGLRSILNFDEVTSKLFPK